MNEQNWNDGLDSLDSSLINEFILEKEQLANKARRRNLFLRIGAFAVCICLLVGIIYSEFLRRNYAGLPTLYVQKTTYTPLGPKYYGDYRAATESDVQISLVDHGEGFSVTATLLEVLPDTYAFYDDFKHLEFRLLHMKVEKCHKGIGMPDEFYYLVPISYMTDFTPYHCFVLLDMAQFATDYWVMYNYTRKELERFPLAIFGYGRTLSRKYMGRRFAAYDKEGNLDERLWQSNEKWENSVDTITVYKNLTEVEKNAGPKGEWQDKTFLFNEFSPEDQTVFDRIMSFENGIYIPEFRDTTVFGLSFHAVRYLNRFPTNEWVSYGPYYNDKFHCSHAQFSEKDLENLPNLAGALLSVYKAFEEGKLYPPHIENEEEIPLHSYCIFPWYAKTKKGVVGVVRVIWRYERHGMWDDAYYIIKPNSSRVKPISRDKLLNLLGENEPCYIYDGDYDTYY